MTELKEYIINLVRKGQSNKQIATALGIKENSVKWHLTDIYKAFSVKSRYELMAMIMGLNLKPNEEIEVQPYKDGYILAPISVTIPAIHTNVDDQYSSHKAV